jgi:hypothetical protein
VSNRHRYTFSISEDLAALDAAFLADLLDQRDQAGSIAVSSYSWSFENFGEWRRIVCSVEAVVPATGANVYVLDDSKDYRDRMWWFAGPRPYSDDSIVYPGHPDDDGFWFLLGGANPAGFVYYTKSGLVDWDGSGSSAYFAPTNRFDTRMWARDTDGALMLGVTDGTDLDPGDNVSLIGHLFVSPKLNLVGATVAGPAALFDAVNGEIVEPHDLNNLQDGQHVDQLPAGGATFALGPIRQGDPPIAHEWTVRGATVRQRLTNPALRRYASFRCDEDARTVIDRAFDWRDRAFYVSAAYSLTTERRPGTAGDVYSGSFHATGTDSEGLTMTGYTGAGGVVTLSATTYGNLYVDPDTGWLYWDMTNAGPTSDLFTMNMLILASPQLGARWPGTNPRLIADPSLGKVESALSDSATVDCTSIVARYRMDRGIVIDGGKVAGIADLTGNGYHLRQLDPSKRCGVPETRASLNSQLALPFSGSEEYSCVKAYPASAAGYHIGMVIEAGPVAADIQPWRLQLPLTTEGQIRGKLLTSYKVQSEWEPNATATPDYVSRDGAVLTTPGQGLAIGWDFPIDADPARLKAQHVLRMLGVPIASGVITVSPAGVGSADVQSLVAIFGESFVGYVAEIIVCTSAQAAIDDFVSSADIVSRYSI